MTADLKAAWIAALRSGDYRQTKHLLRNAQGYCCLGVLCEVVGLPREGVSWYRFRDGGRSMTSLLGALASAVGTNSTMIALQAMNDRGVPFTEIADWIEAHIHPEAVHA